jgi:hypothetical protein
LERVGEDSARDGWGRKKGELPLKGGRLLSEGDHVFSLPYASRLSTFQAPGWGIPAVFSPHRWRNATPWELVPFSYRSASRIFICQPGCTPPPPRGFVGHPLPRRSRERALTGPAGGPDFDNAGLVDGGHRHLQRVGLVGLAPGGPSCRRAAAAPCAREGHPRCRALLGWRSCSGGVLPLHRRGIFTRRPVPHSSRRI